MTTRPRRTAATQPEAPAPLLDTAPASSDALPFADPEPDAETAAHADRLEELLEEKPAAPLALVDDPQAEKDARTKVSGNEWTPEQVALMRRTIAKDLTADEFRLFLAIARRVRLDPLQKQIYAIKRKDKTGNKRMTIQTGIDGYRSIADRTGRYAPGRANEFDVDDKGKLRAARAFVKKQTRDGTWHEVEAMAIFEEYVPNKTDGTQWPKMPFNQLAKCAEALALRRAFPGRFGGVYVDAEMDQADEFVNVPKGRTAVEQSAPAKALEAPRETVKHVDDGQPKAAAAGMIGAIRKYAIEAGVWDDARKVVNYEFPAALGITEPGPYPPQDLAALANASDIVLALRALVLNRGETK